MIKDIDDSILISTLNCDNVLYSIILPIAKIISINLDQLAAIHLPLLFSIALFSNVLLTSSRTLSLFIMLFSISSSIVPILLLLSPLHKL